jgi:signal transduction histidine kinase
MKLRRLPLSVSIALLVFLAELALLGSFAAGAYFLCQKYFLASFDETLRANAMSLPALLESENGAIRLDMESFPDSGARFHRKKAPDLFALTDTSGKILVASPSMKNLPSWAQPKEHRAVFGNLRSGGRNYRGILEPGLLGGEETKNEEKRRVYVFYAADREEMDERLESVASAFLWSVGLLLLVSGALAWAIAWRGLRPLRRLAGEAATIQETTLNRRLSLQNIPVDLEPLATALNDLLERLQKAFERERQFSADAAHELRTSLSVLKSGIQAALLSRRDAMTDRAALEDLLEEVLRLEKLCESLLMIASAHEKKPDKTMPLSEYKQCLAAVVEDFRPRAEQARCTITLSLDEAGYEKEKPGQESDDPLVRADECAVMRIAGNLIENAVRHGGTGVQVGVGIVREERCVILVVEDNGPGIPAEDQLRIFDRFFRSDRTRTRATGGAGLGLALCRALAEMHGGCVRYSPESPKGCRFEWIAEIAAPLKAHSQGLKVEPGP